MRYVLAVLPGLGAVADAHATDAIREALRTPA
jgi:hypothetical protein